MSLTPSVNGARAGNPTPPFAGPNRRPTGAAWLVVAVAAVTVLALLVATFAPTALAGDGDGPGGGLQPYPQPQPEPVELSPQPVEPSLEPEPVAPNDCGTNAVAPGQRLTGVLGACDGPEPRGGLTSIGFGTDGEARTLVLSTVDHLDGVPVDRGVAFLGQVEQPVGIMQEDGAFVVYDKPPAAGGTAVWSTGTAVPGASLVAVNHPPGSQYDGTVAVVAPDGTVLYDFFA